MSFAQLSKRISSYTTRGLLVAMIFVAGLAVGRQVLRWWHADAAAPGAAPRGPEVADGLGDPLVGHLFQFGDARWSMRRAVVRGDEKAAAQALVSAAVAAFASASTPPAPPTEAEQSLLKNLADRPPAAEKAGVGRVYTIDGPFPMAAAVRTGDEPRPTGGKSVANKGSRVVTWGVAAPTVENAWSVYTFWPAEQALPSPLGGVDIPLPPAGARGLVVQTERGGRVTTFRTPEQVEEVVGFYERWCGARGWQRTSELHTRGKAWAARWASPAADATLDIQVRSAATHCDGLLVLTLGTDRKQP